MSNSEQPAIVIKDLYKSFRLPHERHNGLKQLAIGLFNGKRGYEKQDVLKDISFDIKKGEFFGIVGRNGSGKSTLLKLLAGIYAPDKGLIEVNGSLTPFIELGVGFNPELTGRENVYLNGALLGFSREEMEAMYDDIVSFAELEKFMDQKLKNYSSGMQVRLAFSIAIRADTDILILDEVLAVGDAAFQQKCFTYFEKLKHNKKTIVFVTHDMGAVTRFCSRAVMVEDGKIKLIGKPSEIAQQYIIDNIEDVEIKDSVIKASTYAKDLTVESISGTTFSQSDVLKLKSTIELKKNFDAYIGITIARDGASAAEINSKNIKLGMTKGVYEYSALLNVDLSHFNPGVYTVNMALFDRSNGAILDTRFTCLEFYIKGEDKQRGGPLRIAGEWSLSA